MKKLILAACLTFAALSMVACGPTNTGDAGTVDDGGSDTDAGN